MSNFRLTFSFGQCESTPELYGKLCDELCDELNDGLYDELCDKLYNELYHEYHDPYCDRSCTFSAQTFVTDGSSSTIRSILQPQAYLNGGSSSTVATIFSAQNTSAVGAPLSSQNSTIETEEPSNHCVFWIRFQPSNFSSGYSFDRYSGVPILRSITASHVVGV